MITSSQIQELQAIGQSMWTDFSVTEEELADCATRAGWQVTSSLPALRAADLYLACACALARHPAVAAFEKRHAGDIKRALRPMGLPEYQCNEIAQAVLTKLFVPKEGRQPQIEKYQGRGSLAGWIRAVAVRLAIETLRKEKSKEFGVDSPVLEAFAAADVDPDLRALKEQHRTLANQAFEKGFTQLGIRQRNLLRQHYIHQLNIDQLGALYKVHRVTAFRWISKARTDVFNFARAYVSESLGAETQHADELLRLLQSQVDVSLDRLLRSQVEGSSD